MTVLTDVPGIPLTGRALNLSGRGLSLILQQPLPVGAAVRIDQRDRLLLGEIAYCAAEAGTFRLGVQVDQSLRRTRDLAALRQALQAEAGVDANATMKKKAHAPRTIRPEAEAPGERDSPTPQPEHAPAYVRSK